MIEGIQKLVECKDLRKIEEKDRLKLYQLLHTNDVEPSDSLKMKMIIVAAEDQAKVMVASNKPDDMTLLLNILMPFTSEQCEGFDFFKPTLNCLVLEALAHIIAQDQDEAMNSWAIMVKEDVPTDVSQEKVETDWQAQCAVHSCPVTAR